MFDVSTEAANKERRSEGLCTLRDDMIVEILRMLRKDVSAEPQLDNTYLPPRCCLFVAHGQSLMNGISSGSLVPRVDGNARAEATVAICSSELCNHES